MAEEYTAKDIMVLTGVQGVRKRPAMYIGSTGSAGFLHLLYEVLDNAIDESLAGYAKNITIKLSKDEDIDVAEVSDDGRGIPVDIIPKAGKPALEVIMTSLHSGAKFENKAYKVSGGLHGVGLTVVNSLSEYTEVRVKRNGKLYMQKFSRGVPLTSLTEIESNISGSGTTIKFKPDKEIFLVKSFETIQLTERLQDLAFLNPGLHITLIDERDESPKEIKYYSEKGLEDFLSYIKGDKENISKPVYITKDVDNFHVEIIIQYVKSYSEELLSFVNKIKTSEGGMHVAGFHAALTRAILSYNQKNMKKRDIVLEGEDTREGLTAIISVLMQNPEFEGQTKEKLGNVSVKSAVDNVTYAGLSKYFEENPNEAIKILDKVYNAAEARESARRARELARKKGMFDADILPGKLADCTEKDPEKSELFIVEGESAAGSSKQARDRFIQAILPLRGKILNVEKATDEKIFSNTELHTMVTALGTGIKETFSVDGIRYKKIIILTDADVDGSHIKTLLLTFFYRYMRPLVERGYIYIGQPPLYKISHGKEVKYAYSDSELNEVLKQFDGKANVQRYKGLGEMNPEQLWETTMNPKCRILKQITIGDAELANIMFTVLMGLDVEKRRHFLEEHSSEVKFLDI
ncbi:MAG: DNA gyrase subunit B [Candidatus Marsarchaeota archaeon]|nr:DNA gyrase subunit B [Deltaproteobacteria bacterium]MCL5434062.1 DNA gyrase subunit B [Candidatus Marsarchaeota archaeon]